MALKLNCILTREAVWRYKIDPDACIDDFVVGRN